jgi:hypothetical protein
MASATAKPSIHSTPNPVHAGAVVRVHGSAGGCTVGDAVTVLSRAFPHMHTFAGVPAVITTVRPNGDYAKRVRVPLQRAGGISGHPSEASFRELRPHLDQRQRLLPSIQRLDRGGCARSQQAGRAGGRES